MSEELAADELRLPIKRTEGERLEERLTANAYHNILPARYLRKDSDGEVAEQQEELFERVAKNIALAEGVYEAEKHDVELTVSPDQLKPDHPRRDELAEEVFGKGTTADDDAETTLSEYNINKFAYETIVPELPGEIRDHVEEVANEFQEKMEKLSFMPNCVPPQSLVASGGGLKPLTEIEPGERVYDDKDGNARVESKFDNGEKLVKEIETSSGYTVRATPEHYFRVISDDGEYEWRQVKDIQPDDVLALQKNFLDDENSPVKFRPVSETDGGTVVEGSGVENLGRQRAEFERPAVMTPELAEWIGLYLGDGTTRESGVRVAFDEQDNDIVEYWLNLTETVFGFVPTTRKRSDASCIIGQANRRSLYDFLKRNDLTKESSKTATVPEPVLASGRTAIARFLRGLFEADGTVGERSIELYTHSEPLADQVQKLLLGLGIRSTISEKGDGYRVTIRKNVCGKRFVERVGFLSERKRDRTNLYETVAKNASSVKIPHQNERLNEWYQQSDLGHDAYRELSQFLIDSESEYHQEIGRKIFEEYAEKYPELWDSPVAEFVERDQFYEPVTEISDVGLMAVEDMKVPRRNTYVVEGFVSHNSPTLMNAGDELQQLSACFVDSPADDIDDIHQTAKEAAQVFQCLTAETKVFVEDRGIVSIRDVEPGDKIVQRDGSDHRTQRVTETHAYEDSPVCNVTTEAGISLTGTPNHELLVGDSWARIDEISAGDALSLRLGWIQNEESSPELTTVAGGPQWSDQRTVSNDEILDLYEEGLSDYEIAEELDSSASTVQRRRSIELGLDPNGQGGRSGGSVEFDETEFETLYTDEQSDNEIADELGVSTRAVARYRENNALERNGQAVKRVRQPTELSPDLAELLGMWIGDGSKHEDGIRFHLNREETLEHADRLCRELFDVGLDWRWDEGCYDAVIHSHEIKRWWLANFGDAKPDATEASVPDAIWEADRETIGAFLRGLFSTDGSLQKNAYPRLWSSSEELISETQQLLLGIGIPARKWEYDNADREYYNVGPTGKQGLKQFGAAVGFVDSRTEQMDESLDSISLEGPSIGEVHNSTWEVPVEAVEEAGTETVYDVTVGETHEYVASSVVSHNSGGGMGYAFWKLRPYGDAVGSTGGIASGPITFMRTYDQMCFVPGTKILTPSGQVPIEELDEGQLVIDENGDQQPVTETMERSVDEELVEITPKRLNKAIRVTREHPFKVVRDDGFEWVDAGDLTDDDLLVLGHASGKSGLSLDGTIDLTETANGPLVFTDGGVKINREYYGASKGTPPEPLAKEVPVVDFAMIAGWYLAEGNVRYQRGIPSTVTFTLNSDEREAASEIQNALDAFDVPSRVRVVEDRNTLHIHAEHAGFAQFIESQFGTGAAEKTVPELLWRAPPTVQARVLETLFEGDGKLETRGQSQRVQLKLANEEIIDFAFQAGLRCGVQLSRHNRKPDDRKPTYSVSASISTAIGTPLERLFDDVPNDFSPRDRTKQANGREVVAIDSIERSRYEGPVYNAEVADTHTYVAEDLVVHNCETIAQGGARRGAQMGVMRVSHPDVIQFIHAKNKDVSLANTLRLNDPDDFTHNSFADALEEARELIDDDGRVPEHLRNAVEGHLSNFNISVGITDSFMEALKNDEEYTFTNPRTEEPHVATPETVELYEMFDLGEYVEAGEVLSIPAQEIWDDIVQGAHENGEPGVVYLERINKKHSFDVEEHPEHEILATNPCLHGDMEVAVADGRESVPIADLAKEDSPTLVYTLNDEDNLTIREADAFKTKEDADVVEVETDGETTLKLTPDHEVRTRNRGWVEAEDLESGDSLEILTKYDAPLGAVIGNEADADGTEYRWLNTGRRANQAEHRLIASHSGEDIDGKVIHHENHDSLDNRPENLTAMSKEDHDALHDISGENNPINVLQEQGEFEAFKERNPFYDVDGEDNPMYGRSNHWAGLVDWDCSREACSETLELAPAEANHRKYCSRDCANKAKEVHVEFDCRNCGKTIVAHGSGAKDRKYCDRACAAEDTLEGDVKEAFLRHLYVDNPMQREAVKKQKVANTDYEAVGEAISETRQEKIESGELEVEVRDLGEVVCRECGEMFGAVTNTHLESTHGMKTKEYKQEYPDARLHSKQPVVTENHEVTAVSTVSSADVYDLSVPETHNFYAGLNTRENSETRKDVFVNVHNCGEQPLEEYEACNLGHINLSTLAATDAPDWRVWSERHAEEYESQEAAIAAYLEESIDWESFDERIDLGTRFLENVVTMSDFPVDKIEETVREMRKIGLGIMGLAQLYVQLGVRYGSDSANEIARQLMTHINHESKWTSHELATERDSFGEWKNSKYADPTEYREWFEHHTGLDADEWEDGFPVRNHNTTTIAPTGTTSMLGNTTGGCEPIYNVAYYKNVSDDVQGDEMLVEFDDYFLRVLEDNDIDVETVKEEAQEQMAENEFDGVEGLSTVPDAIGELFVTTGDLSAKQHATVQTACQQGVDSAISKTVNAPNDSTLEDAKEVFEYIYDHGGKGVTYYRDGTRSKQVLTTRAQNAEFADMDEGELVEQIQEVFGGIEGFLEHEAVQAALDEQVEAILESADGERDLATEYAKKRPRPDVLHGVTQRIDTGYGKLYVNINEDGEGRPFELFANIGNSGGFTASFTEALAKTISTALRSGVDPDEIADELQGIRSPKVAWDKGEQIQSIPDAIGTAMRRYLDGDVERAYPQQQTLEETAEEVDDEEKAAVETDTETDGGAVSANGTESSGETSIEADQQSIIDAGESPECPECGSLSLYYSEGCKTCESCGWSEC